ncbi:hypothetical protein GGD63_006568 [Bradyrhizobium sp. cir1]|uniref:hypothetical protein n=1 Tax=Bradyrhizobium sp. cir1 TaxID=1445730 RepID=UPI00180BAEB4|nr:hypothetical protein [Bradyrhizobium sp. cir1]MBB4373740.1 hypothetical protein [Bradyrhizobium sp. cir1]
MEYALATEVSGSNPWAQYGPTDARIRAAHHVPTVLTDTDCSIMREAFGRCSALLHSQPGEINPRLAAPSAIKAELDALEKWIAEIRARQEKAA